MVCVVGRMRDLILQLSKSSIYSTKPSSYRSTGFLLIYPPNQGGMRTTDRGSTQKRRERF
ncbi:hypothetical protein KX24_20210 [Salmonella enterica subsp. enterica serovar Berta]|nr:hypothetical protein [Salmonella enterica subsp. enterica serovar Berta]EBV6355257.1 hypothetical protein [Salmonella enterica subsp. enterica serovar Berta]